MKTFPGWRAVGRAMRWARRQDGVEISELKRAGRLYNRYWHRPGKDSGVAVHPNPDRPIAEVRGGSGILEFTASDSYAEVPDAATVLRVLAALDLIPAELAEPCTCPPPYGRSYAPDPWCRAADHITESAETGPVAPPTEERNA